MTLQACPLPFLPDPETSPASRFQETPDASQAKEKDKDQAREDRKVVPVQRRHPAVHKTDGVEKNEEDGDHKAQHS